MNITNKLRYFICFISVKNESHAVIVTNDDIMLAVSQFES